MVDFPSGKSVGIRDLAAYQGISETYLSKVYTKLTKAGIVKSVPGASGGYELNRSPEKITFWDVVAAIEGTSPFFRCIEVRQKEILLDKDNLPDSYTKCPCLIKVVMSEAEEQMRRYLNERTLAWLHNEVKNKIPVEHSKATIEWFNNSKSR
jgi:Rrf2 family protein